MRIKLLAQSFVLLVEVKDISSQFLKLNTDSPVFSWHLHKFDLDFTPLWFSFLLLLRKAVKLVGPSECEFPSLGIYISSRIIVLQ